MTAFRIGRISGPWTNLTPPIRGGTYGGAPQQDASSAPYEDDDTASDVSLERVDSRDTDASLFSLSDRLSSNSSTTSLDTCDKSSTNQPLLRKRHLATVDAWSDEASEVSASSESLETLPLAQIASRHDRTDEILQDEIDGGIKEYPSLDSVTQRNIVLKYQELHQQVHDLGYYDCPYLEYGKEICRYTILFVAFLVALRSGWYITSAAFLGLFWHQIMFTAHDAGHRGITHNFIADTLIGMFIADFCCGLSIGWWKSSHNVHHLVTNHPEHDPDIQNVPLFATSLSFFKSLHSTYYNFTFIWDAFADVAVQYQAYTYYPVMALARFNLYFLSICHVLSPRSRTKSAAYWVRPTEIAFMVCYWYLFGYLLIWRSIPTWTLRVAFVLVSHIVTFPLHVQITLSHWGMPTSDLGEGESFPQRQLRTTMDVDCPAWLDFIHGGLQFQACHHLFPRVPRHNLRKLQVLVRGFCEETKIPYKILGFVDGNRKVVGRLQEVANQVKMMVKCQLHMAETGESGLH